MQTYVWIYLSTKLLYKCLTRKAHSNSDHPTDELFRGRKDRRAVSLAGKDIYREICPWFPKCPGQVSGVGVSKMLLCSVGFSEKLLASDWGSRWSVKVLGGVQVP